MFSHIEREREWFGLPHKLLGRRVYPERAGGSGGVFGALAVIKAAGTQLGLHPVLGVLSLQHSRERRAPAV